MLRRSLIANPLRVSLQKRRFMRDGALSDEKLKLLSGVNPRIHYSDGMYAGSGEQYFLAGLSALECVNEILISAGIHEVSKLLDMPSGCGRELRFFRLRFPAADLTACDIQPAAVRFCEREFNAKPVLSDPDLSRVSFADRFDLIWCGSLVTHLDADSTVKLLRLFARHLNAGGIAIFTFHGEYVLRRMRDGENYELNPDDVRAMLAEYESSGHAYSDYPRGLGYFTFHPEGTGYGVSLTSPEWLRERLAEIGGIEEIFFRERGWAGHQDVMAFRRRAANGEQR
jgi:SAM-dependent methyltransferase